MARINLTDLQPQEAELTTKELTKIKGGAKLLPGVGTPLSGSPSSTVTDPVSCGRTY